MTERLYYNDSYVRNFQARVVETTDGGRRVYLDRTCADHTPRGSAVEVPGKSGAVGVVAGCASRAANSEYRLDLRRLYGRAYLEE
jgi:hypothetical protein